MTGNLQLYDEPGGLISETPTNDTLLLMTLLLYATLR